MRTQAQGDQAKTKRKRDPKDFDANYEAAKYIAAGKTPWLGINASGIRNGCIETCRVAGMVMTRAKMSIMVREDGIDYLDATPLVRVHGKAEKSIDAVRNDSGVIDLRARVMWLEWSMRPRLWFDESQFSPSDVINLMIRVGLQNGLGEGRPNSSNGNGCGNGLFEVVVDEIALERLPVNPFFFKEMKT